MGGRRPRPTRSRPQPRACVTCGSPRSSGRTSRSRTARSSSTGSGSRSRSSTSRASSSYLNTSSATARWSGLPEAAGAVAELRGYTRRWQVAMDNTRDLPGYKYYVDPETGERPAIYVAYLDLAPDPETSTTGIKFAVDEEALEALDRRERNYERVEVAEGLWAYMGTQAARGRFERGRANGTAVVDRAYYERVTEGLAQIGASLDRPPVPIRTLARIDMPLAKGPSSP